MPGSPGGSVRVLQAESAAAAASVARSVVRCMGPSLHKARGEREGSAYRCNCATGALVGQGAEAVVVGGNLDPTGHQAQRLLHPAAVARPAGPLAAAREQRL